MLTKQKQDNSKTVDIDMQTTWAGNPLTPMTSLLIHCILCSWSHVVRFSVFIHHKFLLIRSSIDPTFCGIFVWGPMQFKCQFITWSNEDSEVGISRKFEKLVNMYIRK